MEGMANAFLGTMMSDVALKIISCPQAIIAPSALISHIFSKVCYARLLCVSGVLQQKGDRPDLCFGCLQWEDRQQAVRTEQEAGVQSRSWWVHYGKQYCFHSECQRQERP